MTEPNIQKARFRTALSVWITRAQPGAASTAALLKGSGLQPLIVPVLRFRSIKSPAPPILAADEAIAFTSIQGVRRAAALFSSRKNAVFAVGDATADAARSFGFAQVLSANGDVSALVRLIVDARPSGGVVHPSATETAGDLVGALTAQGLQARTLAIYRTQALSRLPGAVRSSMAGKTLGAVLIHSPKAARTVAALLANEANRPDDVTALGMSEACLAPLRPVGFKAFISADAPTEEALMTAISRASLQR